MYKDSNNFFFLDSNNSNLHHHTQRNTITLRKSSSKHLFAILKQRTSQKPRNDKHTHTQKKKKKKCQNFPSISANGYSNKQKATLPSLSSPNLE